MGLEQQAVLDFDEEIRVPWRPRLVAVGGEGDRIGAETWSRRPRPSGRSSSRVGVCRPVEVRPLQRADQPPADRSRHRPAVSAGRRRAGRRRMRLTRRARLLAAVLTLAVGVAIGSWLGPLLGAGDGDLRLAGAQSVVVQPGDTLWSIATDIAGTADVREVVARIQQLNHLHGTVLVPGQVVGLP